MAGFTVRSSEAVGSLGFLELRQLEVASPDGDTFTRVVVEHPGAVAVVPVTDDGRVLLLRQWRAPVGGELLEIPAGKRDVEGEAPEETARRELEEETGFTAGRLVKLAQFWNSPGFCTEETHLFLALDLTPCDSVHDLKAEERHLTLEYVPLDDLDDAAAFADAKTLIGVALARKHLAP